MTDFTTWNARVLRESGEEDLDRLEASVPGSHARYPLLGEERGGLEEPSQLQWTTRVVLERFPEQGFEPPDQWLEVVAGKPLRGEHLESLLRVVRVDGEAFVTVDLHLLRNVAEIRRLRETHPDIECWVLVTEESVEADPEKLVGETIRLLTGVLSGCRRLEIRQQSGESLSSVRARLNVARLMHFESGLGQLSDPLPGAGLFEELQRRLSLSK